MQVYSSLYPVKHANSVVIDEAEEIINSSGTSGVYAISAQSRFVYKLHPSELSRSRHALVVFSRDSDTPRRVSRMLSENMIYSFRWMLALPYVIFNEVILVHIEGHSMLLSDINNNI
jgi:hypothetical protein